MKWQRQGPQPITRGQVENIFDGEVVGAIQALAVHPVDSAVVYAAAVNGGIWRTINAMAAQPTWQPLTDLERSLSFGALAIDPTDPTHLTLLAGTGRFSSNARSGGALIGLLRSVDGGATWTTLQIDPVRPLHVTGVAPRGNTILASDNTAGVHRSTNAGVTWTLVSGAPGTGLPAGPAFDLAGDPADPARLYTHAGNSGLYRSTNSGATWSKISNPAIDALLPGSTNIRMSIGTADNVYVAICGASRRLAGLFRSGNGGAIWNSLDLPRTTEAGGVVFGLHPGAQASIHLSIAADRNNPDIVYVGGDRQPAFTEGAQLPGAPRFPNSIGARDFSGRLFRIDASRPPGAQSTPLTHSGTASGSAPHADSRDMALAPNGMLIESDDGGIYRHTRPQRGDGDWFSMNGDLQVTEFHSVAWDANCRTIIGGAQDTGSPQQLVNAARRWPSVSTGDGGVVAVDAISTPGRSTRYSSFQFLGGLRREVYNTAGMLQSRTPVALRVLGGGPPLAAQFYTPLELNRVAPTRLVIGATNGVYESDDQGDTLTAIAPGLQVNGSGPIAYGATGNSDVLYIGSGSSVFVRTAARPTPLTASGTYPGAATVVGIAVDPDDPRVAFVIDALQVFRTTDAGGQWNIVTGNLPARGAAVLRSVVYCPDLGGGSVVVGTNSGVFVAAGPAFSVWSKLGTDLPLAPVLRLQYSGQDRVLLAGTLGRGAWTLTLPAPVP
ncbi:WD40/YVTN/BNR-like repeat-containing protein [Geodermatophilus africanus]|nr:RTX toxin [Geodermatophilus africanus]